jgi:DNA-directed RNA polymerase subunit RPC12/RpoP
MSGTAWYTMAMTCCRCGARVEAAATQLQSRALNLHAHDLSLAPGDLLDIGVDDLADAFAPTALWPPAASLRALEYWPCPHCGSAQAALLTWADEGAAGWRLLAGEAACLTPELLSSVHGASQALRDTLSPDQLALLNPAG